MNAKATKGIFWISIGLILFLAVATFIGGDLNIAAAQARTNVRLVLQITIDGPLMIMLKFDNSSIHNVAIGRIYLHFTSYPEIADETKYCV